MLTTPDNLLFFHLLDDGLQDKLLHHLSRDGGEADRPVVPWVLTPVSKVPLQLSHRPLQALVAALRSPPSFLLSRLTSPSSLSLSSQQRGSSPRIMAGASSGPTPTAPALSCAEGSRAGRRTPRGVSAERGRGAESPLSGKRLQLHYRNPTPFHLIQ